MKRGHTILIAALAMPMLQGCLIADAAGAAIGFTTGAIATAGDMLTSDDDAREAEATERMQREAAEERQKRQDQFGDPI